jgi:hypothetical protein
LPAHGIQLSSSERAIELAKSGSCRNAAELETRLKKEGYGSIRQHLAGSATLRKRLNELCRSRAIRSTGQVIANRMGMDIDRPELHRGTSRLIMSVFSAVVE